MDYAVFAPEFSRGSAADFSYCIFMPTWQIAAIEPLKFLTQMLTNVKPVRLRF